MVHFYMVWINLEQAHYNTGFITMVHFYMVWINLEFQGWRPRHWQEWEGTEPKVHQEGNRLAGAVIAGSNNEG